MTQTPEDRISEAKKRLWATLSDQKFDASGYSHGTEVEYKPIAAVIELQQARTALRATLDQSKHQTVKMDGCPVCQKAARAQLRQTLSGGKASVSEPTLSESTLQYRTESGSVIATEVQQNSVDNLTAAREELVRVLSNGKKSIRRDAAYAAADMKMKYNTAVIEPTPMEKLNAAATIALAKDQLLKTMQCGRGRGIRNVTDDSNLTNTDSVTPFTGGFPISVRSRGTLEELVQDESEPIDTAVPAVDSGQTGTSNWSPNDQNGDHGEEQEHFDPEKESAAILQIYTGGNGKIRKHAKYYFLYVNNSGENSTDYSHPLARMDDVSQSLKYDSDAIDAAWRAIDGSTTGLAVRSLQNRLLRIKQREHMALTPDQTDYLNRHIVSPSAPTDEEKQNAIIRTLGRK